MKSEINKIQEILKETMKVRGVNYTELSKELNISLATVKRFLNGDDIHFNKLIEFCTALKLDFYDVVERAKKLEFSLYEFSYEQEAVLAKDSNNFVVFRSILLEEERSFIRKKLNLSEIKIEQILYELEKVKLIELWPNDRVKVLVKSPFKWIYNGPLESRYKKNILDKLKWELDKVELNKLSVGSETSQCFVKELRLSEKESLSFKQELNSLFDKYNHLGSLRINHGAKEGNILSAFSLVGNFSWWESLLTDD